MGKGGGKSKGKKQKVYGPATVLKPVIIGGFVMMFLNLVIGVALGGQLPIKR